MTSLLSFHVLLYVDFPKLFLFRFQTYTSQRERLRKTIVCKITVSHKMEKSLKSAYPIFVSRNLLSHLKLSTILKIEGFSLKYSHEIAAFYSDAIPSTDLFDHRRSVPAGSPRRASFTMGPFSSRSNRIPRPDSQRTTSTSCQGHREIIVGGGEASHGLPIGRTRRIIGK